VLGISAMPSGSVGIAQGKAQPAKKFIKRQAQAFYEMVHPLLNNMIDTHLVITFYNLLFRYIVKFGAMLFVCPILS
jgi:hypothetical protein